MEVTYIDSISSSRSERHKQVPGANIPNAPVPSSWCITFSVTHPWPPVEFPDKLTEEGEVWVWFTDGSAPYAGTTPKEQLQPHSPVLGTGDHLPALSVIVSLAWREGRLQVRNDTDSWAVANGLAEWPGPWEKHN